MIGSARLGRMKEVALIESKLTIKKPTATCVYLMMSIYNLIVMLIIFP